MMTEKKYILNDWLVDPTCGQIVRGKESHHLEPLVMRALAFLIHNPNKVVSKDRLIEAVWGHSNVSDAALTRCIFEIRRAFGDDAKVPRIVETIPRIGYRLVASLRIAPAEKQFRATVFATSVAALILAGVFLVFGARTGTDGSPTGGVTGLPTSNSIAYDTYKKAVVQYEQNTYLGNENAIVLFGDAIEHDSGFGLAYAGLSDALSRKVRFWDGDRLSEARAAADNAIEFAPTQAQSHNARGMALALNGEDQEALVSFQRAYTLEPGHWQSAYSAALLYRQRVEYSKATSLFLQALKYSPAHVDAMTHLGFLHLRMGKIESAREWLQRAIDQAPLAPHAWSQMATLEMVAGNTDKAIDNCVKVREFHPNDKVCVHVLGVSNLLEGNAAAARSWFDYAEKNFENDRYARLGNAQVLLAEGNRDQAMAIVGKMLERADRDVSESDYPWEEYWVLAACHALQGDLKSAFTWLDKAAAGGRRFYLWDSTDPVFASLHGDQRFERYIEMTQGDIL